MIEKNTVPLSEDTTNIMEMIENAAFDFTLPEPLPTTTLHITDHKAEGEQMVEVNDTAETFSTWTSLDDANLGLCLPAIEAEGRIELPSDLLATMWSQAKRTTCLSGSWTTTRLPTSTSPTRWRRPPQASSSRSQAKRTTCLSGSWTTTRLP